MEMTDDRYLVIIGKPVLGQWSVTPINIWIMSAYFTLIFIYLLKVNKTWNLFKVSIKDSSKRWRRFGIFIADFEQIEHLVLVIPLLGLNR